MLKKNIVFLLISLLLNELGHMVAKIKLLREKVLLHLLVLLEGNTDLQNVL